MKRIYYFIQSDTDAYEAAIFFVRVGRSSRDRRALGEIERAAVRSSRFFLCRRCVACQSFVGRLFQQNFRRPVHVVSPVLLLSILKSRANAEHVENLSPQFVREAKRIVYQTHILPLCQNF